MAKMKSVKYNYSGIKFTIRERYNSWYLDFYFEGKRIRRDSNIPATKDGLIEVKRVLIPEIAASLLDNVTPPYEDKDWTLNDLAEIYWTLKKGKKSKMREHTLSRNIAHYNNHVSPYFGSRLVDTLLPMELEQWQNKLLEKYKSSTVQKFRSILYSILDQGVKNDILQKNPLDRLTAPKVMFDLKYDDEKKPDPFTADEMQIILDNTNRYKRNLYMRNYILLLYSSGMRPGEAAALRWSDIDFERKRISITKTRIRGKDGPPKTAASYRTIDMLPLAEEALRDQYEHTKDYEHVFINSHKQTFYSHDIIGVNFKKILKQTGIKERVLYNLRHTYASQMITNGVDIIYVSKQLGHDNPNITLEIYTHFIEEDDEKRLKKIEEIGTKMVTFKKGNS
ncbi:Phage integrase [hydrothermal vent metagenome]|uniref:Phage integrase n=1 Tax=hydrothermal vent metagenome TaxID=652676 RepID=A0A1W1CNS1_9ZZZZ